ncbi:MAG TPA: GNAT family N-acetyltransferase [Longimicrobium sp.]|nr:GNAT family N-acetyltransferase [Longimicrobium sp.]
MTEEIRWRIADADPEDAGVLERMAALLVEEFREHSPAWPDLETALADVRECVQPEHIARVAFTPDGEVLGWIGARPAYDGNVWELHPLVVSGAHQRRGVGRALVADLEERARERGGWTMYLGTDDEDGRTSLGGADLYPDVLDRAKELRDLGGHPFAFYRKAGYAVVGLLPDANGFGKPDIFMAKRLRRADGGT